MGKGVSWFDASQIAPREIWEQHCAPDEFAIVPPSVIQTLLPCLPQALVAKTQKGVIVASGTAYGVVYMINLLRIDERDKAVDQEPFALAFIGENPTISGCLLHHGDWQGRTVHFADDIWEYITASGVGDFYRLLDLPLKERGRLDELDKTSHQEAFRKAVQELYSMVKEWLNSGSLDNNNEEKKQDFGTT